MQDTETILATHSINNPTDAALVRLAAVAVAQPKTSPDELLSRASFAHPGDAALARAIIETVRANQPPVPVVSRKPNLAAAIVGAVALSLAAWLVVASRSLSAERTAREQQVQRFTKELSDLQAASGAKLGELQAVTTNALKKSDESTRETSTLFTKTIGQQTERIAALSSEVERLKAERDQLKAELAAAKTQKVP